MPFLQNYYTQYGARAQGGAIVGLYHPQKSQLSMGETAKFPPAVGQAAIAPMHLGTPATAADEAKPPRMPPGRHDIQTVDAASLIDVGAAPVNGISAALLVLVTGRIMLDGEANPLNFLQCFLVATEAGANYIANELFSLIYA